MSSTMKISAIHLEAETYLSQGLYKEALTVYRDFLAKNRIVDPNLSKTIDESINRIRKIAIDHNCKKDVSMPCFVVPLYKADSNEKATVKDRLRNAKAYIDSGSYDRAWEEYRRLLRKKYLTSAVMTGVALCLVNLVKPKDIASTVDHLARDTFKHPGNRKAFIRSISKIVSKDQYPQHFSALARHYLAVNGNPM